MILKERERAEGVKEGSVRGGELEGGWGGGGARGGLEGRSSEREDWAEKGVFDFQSMRQAQI